MEKPEFELGARVIDAGEFYSNFLPPSRIIGIVMHECPCGCGHVWYEYQLNSNVTRTKRLLIEVTD
jgi:hypothetical protein